MKLDTAVFTSPSLPPRFPQKCRFGRGFTLIELSIVLVVIGLLVGGVLVGRDLIKASETRAQISQIEKYNQAVNTFRDKTGYLPGDIPAVSAAQFGLPARSATLNPGYFDGNGLIQGNNSFLGSNYNDASGIIFNGETVYFWVDLSASHLIEGNYAYAVNNNDLCDDTHVAQCFPAASIGNGNYVYAWSGGIAANRSLAGGGPLGGGGDGVNYFGLSAIKSITSGGSYMQSTTGLSVAKAYDIDRKIDDGLPQSGRVQAFYLNDITNSESRPLWAGTSNRGSAAYTTATAGASTTCFDNNTATGNPQQYSINQNNGAGINCALSFKFQ